MYPESDMSFGSVCRYASKAAACGLEDLGVNKEDVTN